MRRIIRMPWLNMQQSLLSWTKTHAGCLVMEIRMGDFGSNEPINRAVKGAIGRKKKR